MPFRWDAPRNRRWGTCHGRAVHSQPNQCQFQSDRPSAPTIVLQGLPEVQKKALRLADNKIALNAGWDVKILKLEIAAVGTLDVEFDLSLTGFASGGIDVILKGSSDADDEAIPAVPVEPRSFATSVMLLTPKWSSWAGTAATAPTCGTILP